MSLYRNFFSVGAMTMLSRVTGFARDILMAQVLGTGLAADAFFAAFRFPNLFRRLFAEGAFNAAFIPLFSGALEKTGEPSARLLAGRIISWLTLFLVGLTILAELFMPQVIALFVPGFLDNPEKFDLTVTLTRVCFPYLACMSLMAAFGAILNSLGRFVAAAFAPVLLNLVLITTLIGLVLISSDSQFNAWILAWGVLVGGICQFALVFWVLRRAGFLPHLTLPRWDKTMRRFWALAVPAILTGGITQINIFIGTIIASGAASAISYLYYADRLYQLPLGIIGIAIGVVLLPELSRHLKGNRLEEAKRAFDNSLLISMLLCVPAAVALFALASPIIHVLFERGAFDAAARVATADALMAFACGLPAFVLIKVFQPGFFAREDTLTPTLLAGISVAINVGVSLALFASFAHVGIAIATSLAAWVNALGLGFLLWRRGYFAPTLAQARNLAMITTLSLLMGLGAWALATSMNALLFGPSLLIKLALLMALVTGSALAYFVLIHLTGTLRFNRLLGQFRRN